MDVIQQIEILAEKLDILCEEVVIVGGCSPTLILDFAAAPDLRPTDDVDILVQTESYGKYQAFVKEIKKRGFVEKLGDPIGRYTYGELVVDVVPTEADVLGFTNRWYKAAFVHAVHRKLPSGRSVKTVTSVYFVATKFEAFKARGKGDPMANPDLEDIFTLMVESPSFEKELEESAPDVRQYISMQFENLVSNRDYPHFLPGYFRGDEASQAFLPELRKMIERIASSKL